MNRKAKQRKADRIGARKMVRALLAHDRGDAAVLSRVRIPCCSAWNIDPLLGVIGVQN